MESRKLNPLFEDVANKLIDQIPELENIKKSCVKIKYLESDLAKKNGQHIVFGECEKVPAKYKWSLNCDFTITIYSPNCEHMNDGQFAILLFHELLHVGIEFEPGGSESYSIVKHDLEDFKTIIDKYGTDWAIKK